MSTITVPLEETSLSLFLKTSLLNPPHFSQPPGNHSTFYHLCNFAFSKWNIILIMQFVVFLHYFFTLQFSSVAQSCPTLCDPMNRSTPGLRVHYQLPEFTQTHVHWVGDGIQPSHPLSSPSPPAPNPSQHQGLVKWVSSLPQVAKGLQFQLQHQSFQWIFRTDLL